MRELLMSCLFEGWKRRIDLNIFGDTFTGLRDKQSDTIET